MQVKPTVVTPLLVERFRSALPPRAQTEINSVTEAPKNCALVLDDIFTTFTESQKIDLRTSGQFGVQEISHCLHVKRYI